jgi:hypothetical protein
VNPFKAAARRVLQALGLYVFYSLGTSGPLRDDGWLRSYREGVPVDAEGRPLPWITYPAIEFLAPRLRGDLRVFEYGCGHSTLWWAARVREVVACEHDEAWAARIRTRAPANVTLLHVPLEYGGEYSRVVARQGRRFDIVVVDGRDRVHCAESAPQGLTEGGVILWDNTDREEYREGLAFLEAAGFRRIPFVGLAPGINLKTETSVFYRDRNCLGL